jgi:hypothetical protein
MRALMFTFARACLQADKLVAGAFLVFACGGCGARTGFDTEPIEGTLVGEPPAFEDASGEGSAEDASPGSCGSFTTIASCTAGGCGACVSSTGWWICIDPIGGAIIEDDAGRELGACGNLSGGDVVTGPRQRL